MSLSDRRNFLLCFVALGACGFSPAYGPDGNASALQGRIALDPPTTQSGYAFTRRFEERLGRPAPARYALSVRIETASDGLGTTADGRTTRYRLLGRASYSLTDTSSGKVLSERRTVAFTGYSASGSNVATLAAERDATERLMVILADQIVDQLVLLAPDLPS